MNRVYLYRLQSLDAFRSSFHTIFGYFDQITSWYMDYDESATNFRVSWGRIFSSGSEFTRWNRNHGFFQIPDFYFQWLSISLNQDHSGFFFNVAWSYVSRFIGLEYCVDSIYILKIVFNRYFQPF